MTDLAERIEAAGVDEQRAMLEEAFAHIHNMDDGLVPADWSALNWPLADRFTAMLDAEAYESAAMMLLPEGWKPLRITWFHNAVEVSMMSGFATSTGRATTPALALAAAAIRSQPLALPNGSRRLEAMNSGRALDHAVKQIRSQP